MEEEIWKDVPEYEGTYQVSNMGKVRSLDRIVATGGGYKRQKGYVLYPVNNHNGYMGVTLNKEGKSKHASIHRLVATVFVPNPDNKHIVDHINGIRSDNRAENLRWCTSHENNSFDLARQHNSEARKGDKCYWYGKKQPQEMIKKRTQHYKGSGNPFARRVIQSDPDGVIIKEWSSLAEVAAAFGVSRAAVSQWASDCRVTRYGHIWTYAESKADTCDMMPVLQYNRKGEFVKEWANLHNAAIELNCTSSAIRACCIDKLPSAKNYVWRYKKSDDYPKQIEPHPRRITSQKPVIQYTLEGTFVAEYPSAAEAERQTGIANCCISVACIGRISHKAGNYQWRFKQGNETPQVIEPITLKYKGVLQYSINGKFIKQWNTITEAERELNIGHSRIVAVCQNKAIHAGGYYWRYYGGDIKIIVDVPQPYRITHPVCQYTIDGKFIAEYNSLNEAANKLSICRSGISQVLRGKVKTSAGYIWKYKDEQ